MVTVARGLAKPRRQIGAERFPRRVPGSLADTVSPRARNTAVQLAPIVPVPIAATRLILSPAMSGSSRPEAFAEPKLGCRIATNRLSPCYQGLFGRSEYGFLPTNTVLD